jgi:hypothetical protein
VNEKLAADALFALHAKGFETYKGYCSRWCRQVCEYSYGDARYNNQWRPNASPSAKDAALSFKSSGYAVTGTPQIGDILFKTVGSGGFGHVGILTEKGVAENSSYHWGPSGGRDARGLRSLAQFGPFQVIIRLPPLHAKVVTPTPAAAQPTQKYLLNGSLLENARLIENRLFVPVREVTDALGYELDAADVDKLRAWPKVVKP